MILILKICFCFLIIFNFGVISVNCNKDIDFGSLAVHNIQLLASKNWQDELRDTSPNITALLNDYVDQMVPLLNAAVHIPIKIPDYNLSLHTDVAYILPLFGSLRLINAEVTDVGIISRSGDAPVKYIEEALTLSLALTVKAVKFSGDFIADLEMLSVSGSLSGGIDQIKVQASLTVDANKVKAKVNQFYMEAGSVSLKVDILPVLNSILNTLIDVLVYIIKWPLLSLISSEIRGSIQNMLDSYTNLFQ